MWSAVPGIDDMPSTSDSEEEKWSDSSDKCSHRPQSPDTTVASSDNSETAPPRDVSAQHWQTFCKLKRRREDMLQSGTQGKLDKRKRKHKVEQKDVVSTEIGPPTCISPPSPPSTPSTSSTAAVGAMMSSSLSSSLSSSSDCKRRRKTRDTSPSLQPDAISHLPAPAKGTSPTPEQKEHWAELNKHLHVNEHIFQGIDHGQYNPHKSGLEKKIDEAVTEGNFDQAEDLSNELATRHLACKITKSVDARDYLKWKEAEEMRRKAKRKKTKKNWGFEAKERWQMKGNM